MTDDAQETPDYGHLPSDVLRLIFSTVFSCKAAAREAQGTQAQGWDFLSAYRQWISIRLTCRHWEEVLSGTPPAINLFLTPAPAELLLKWLPGVPLRLLAASGALETEYGPALESSDEEDEEQQGGGAEGGPQGGPREDPPGLITTRSILLGLEGIGPRPFWSMAAFQQLQVLQLCHNRLTARGPLTFQASTLQPLSHLTRLQLGEFTDFELGGVPESVRWLELWYDGRSQFSMPQLPQHLRLDLLVVGKEEGVVGVCLGGLWDCCKEVALQVPQAIVGVPSPEALVRQFERPYREGIYVPPHILGDMEQLERSHEAAASSLNHFFAGLSRSTLLKALHFAGGCGTAIKFIPMRAGDAEALPFAFRNQPAGLGMVRDVNFLYSLGAREVQAWARDWMDQQMVLAEEGEVPMPGRGAAGAVAVGCGVGAAHAHTYELATVRVAREGEAPHSCAYEWQEGKEPEQA